MHRWTMGSKTLAGVLLAHFERVSHVNHIFKNRRNMYTASLRMQYSWILEFYSANICSTSGPGNFLLTKNIHGPSMYTLSMVGINRKVAGAILRCTSISE